MRRFLAICLVFFTVGFFSNAYADGTSGCGLGTQIWKGNKGMLYHLMAVTTNNYFSGTSSQTSGTSSGCDATRAVEKERIQRIYLAHNYENLMEDISQGQGIYLATYAGLFGCSQEGTRHFSQVSKSTFSVLFDEATTAKEVINSTKEMIQQDKVLAQSCSI